MSSPSMLRPAIVLITDFGDSPYTGILRLVAKSIAPDVDVIDGTHSVQSFNVLAGAYVVYNTYRWAPRGSVIVAVIDPGVGSSRAAIAVRAGDYYFVGPDNGVLYPAIAKEGFLHGVSLDPEKVTRLAAERFTGKLPGRTWQVSNTFHGRDLFTPAAALIASGVSLDSLGSPLSQADLRKLALEYIEKTEEGLKAKVVYIDKFGNVALSIPSGAVPLFSWSKLVVHTPAGSFTVPVGRKFSDVSPGDLVAYENSFGFLEIAANMDNAARKLGVSIGDLVLVTPL